MKKQTLPRLTLKRETIQQLDATILRGVPGAGASAVEICGTVSGRCPATQDP